MVKQKNHTAREKYCEICKGSFSPMFRIQYKPNKTWCFVCEPCLIFIKENNPNYRYGGTWKK